MEGAAAAKDDIKRSRLILMQLHRPFWRQRTTIQSLTKSLGRALQKRKRCLRIIEAFFAKQEEVSKKQAALDKELFRLNSQREKLKEASETQINYMWDEYEITPHAASELRNDAYDDLPSLKKLIAGIKGRNQTPRRCKCQRY